MIEAMSSLAPTMLITRVRSTTSGLPAARTAFHAAERSAATFNDTVVTASRTPPGVERSPAPWRAYIFLRGFANPHQHDVKRDPSFPLPCTTSPAPGCRRPVKDASSKAGGSARARLDRAAAVRPNWRLAG